MLRSLSTLSFSSFLPQSPLPSFSVPSYSLLFFPPPSVASAVDFTSLSTPLSFYFLPFLIFALSLIFPFLSCLLLSLLVLYSPPPVSPLCVSPLLPFSPRPFLSSCPPPLSPLALRSLLHPGTLTCHLTLRETKAPSLGWSWEELSVPSALFDDSISNDTLILTPHCLFFLHDEIQLERRATGHIIKTWLKRKEPRLALEAARNYFLTHQRKEHNRVGDEGIVEKSGNPAPTPQITLR